MAIMTDATDIIIQRVAFNSQNETFEAGKFLVSRDVDNSEGGLTR
jgi:hypothetical protein